MGQQQHRGRRNAIRIAFVAVPLLAVLVGAALTHASTLLLVVLAGLGLVVGVVGVFRGGNPALRIRGRRGAGAVLAVSLAGLAAGGSAFAAPERPASFQEDAPARVAALPKAQSAVTALDGLTVKGPSPMTGYHRTQDFGPAWLDVDRNGCDTRDDILRRDLTAVTRTKCIVRSGVLHDPYTGKTIRFVRGVKTSTAVQIDHLVPLADAWRTGAQKLTAAQRVDLANDPINLLAVDGPTNEAKGDGDAATWLPKNKAFRCTYVAHQIGVKRAYGLWVTKAEKAAMARVLSACPSITVPVSAVSHRIPPGYTVPRPVASVSPEPSASATSSSAPSASASVQPSTAASSAPTTDQGTVHAGSFCTPAGATGRTNTGTAMVCATGSDGRLRWRSAA